MNDKVDPIAEAAKEVEKWLMGSEISTVIPQIEAIMRKHVGSVSPSAGVRERAERAAVRINAVMIDRFHRMIKLPSVPELTEFITAEFASFDAAEAMKRACVDAVKVKLGDAQVGKLKQIIIETLEAVELSKGGDRDAEESTRIST